MKRILSYLTLSCFAACVLTGCTGDDIPAVPAAGGNSIRLGISGIERMTRAAVDDTETRVDRLDVLIFDAAGNRKYHERVPVGNAEDGVVTLRAQRSSFAPDTEYWVYLIANTSFSEDTFSEENLKTLEDLQKLVQRDENIHMTGQSDNAPRSFLMDGIAYPKDDGDEPDAPKRVVLYDTNATDTELMVTLRRAAAKIVVHILKGDRITFDDFETAAQNDCGYYLRNMPFSTPLIAGVERAAELRTPGKSRAGYLEWGVGDKLQIDEVRVTAYAYSHDWDGKSILESEPRLIVNLPMHAGETFHPYSYYQIPICRPTTKRLERNHLYEVTVRVNAPGATDAAEPEELTPIRYSVVDWVEEEIGIGGETDRPRFLMVNTDTVEMHNIAEDRTSLNFASSAEVTVTVKKAWYYDKNDDEQPLLNVETMGIRATPDRSLSGNISITSPVPTNNAPRYIHLIVENGESEPRDVTVIQYPLEYITNIHGWYSYRDDLSGNPDALTNWEYVYGNYVGGDDTDTYRSNTYYSNTQLNVVNDYFYSKVRKENEIYRYTWSRSGSSSRGYIYTRDSDTKLGSNQTNFRMYHIRITASSGDYTLGRPRINDAGITDESVENSKIVSPSFLIASQLGALRTRVATKAEAAEHCRRYVEVYKVLDSKGNMIGKKELTEWRLPTQREIGIILGYQKPESEGGSPAIDEVMIGDHYWAANGGVDKENWENVTDNPSSGGFWPQRGAYVRCVHDAYGDEN